MDLITANMAEIAPVSQVSSSSRYITITPSTNQMCLLRKHTCYAVKAKMSAFKKNAGMWPFTQLEAAIPV